MRFVVLAALILSCLLILALLFRVLDWFRDRAACRQLVDCASYDAPAFDMAMVAELPEPARRYFAFSIQPGTRLSTVAEIEMEGELGLGDKVDPGYRPMQARQILASPHGLVWRLRTGPISGSDGALPETSWTRFWLLNLLPVVRVSGNADHHRSAFGRVVAEAAFWTPAALLPAQDVTWEPTGADSARATVSAHGFTQAVEIFVDAQGAPVEVRIERWSNENPDKSFRLQPFGGTLSEHRAFGGFRVPTRVEGGNHIGTEAYFPFYKARVARMEFL